MYLFLCVCVEVHICKCVHIHVEDSTTLPVVAQTMSTMSFEIGSLVGLEPSLPGQQAPRTGLVFTSSVLVLEVHSTLLRFYMPSVTQTDSHACGLTVFC